MPITKCRKKKHQRKLYTHSETETEGRILCFLFYRIKQADTKEIQKFMGTILFPCSSFATSRHNAWGGGSASRNLLLAFKD